MGSAAEVTCTEVDGAESDCVVVVVVKNEAACMRVGELVCTDVVTTNVGSRIEFCTKLASWVEVMPRDIREGVGSILAGSDAGNWVSPSESTDSAIEIASALTCKAPTVARKQHAVTNDVIINSCNFLLVIMASLLKL